MDTISCFITGNRPKRFRFKAGEENDLCRKIKLSLRAEIERHYNQEQVRSFYIGGALGADIWGAEIILELKKREEYKEMKLFLVRPFPEHGEDYEEEQRKRYRNILENCDESTVTYARYTPSAYKKRNYHMVDLCQYGIVVYDNDRSIRTGTGQTVEYAQKQHVRIKLIHPDTAEVTLA